MLKEKVSLPQVFVILVLLVVGFVLCMGDKTLVGLLVVVPMLILLVGIPSVVSIWVSRVRRLTGNKPTNVDDFPE